MLSRTSTFRVFGNPDNDASPLQLPSVHPNPSCDGVCRWC